MKPTRLYVKRHKITGKLYFGKTSKTNIEAYTGSGIHWLRHLKVHGKHIETIWVSEQFIDRELIVEFSTFFSEFFDIVNSDSWLNLIVENGLDGAPLGVANSGPSGNKNGMYGKVKELNPFYGKQHSVELKQKWSESRKGELNPNYGAKAFTDKTIALLRRPKPNKENYRGTPGKIACIDKSGNVVQISTDIYHAQKLLNSSPETWDYVNTNSKEAKRRKSLSNNATDIRTI